MAQTDAINNKFIIPQQNYYSGVKIDIHNPTVNVPNNTDGYAKPDFQIYQYDTKPINVYQPPYIPTRQASPKAVAPTNTSENIPLPEAQPVKELPESVLKPIKIAIPEPAYVNLPQTEPENTQEQIASEIKEPPVLETLETQDKQIEVPNDIIEKAPAALKQEIQEVKEEIKVAPPAEEKILEQQPAIENQTTEVVKSPIEIVPPATNPIPRLDYNKVSENLNSPNFDVQALQLKEIFDAAPNKEEFKHYIKEQIFLDVINIVNKDASTLAGPTDAQTQIRTKIIENHIARANQEKAGAKEITYPHQLSEQDINYANALAPRELAERNREYAIKTLALLSKEFTTQVEAANGTIVPITDVPGMSAIVNSLKNENFLIRLTALEALSYIQHPEYTNELRPIYEALINTDKEAYVRNAAQYVLEELVSMKTAQAA